MTKCLKSELRLVFRNSVSWILLVSKRIKRHNTICGTVLSITYFCKRGSHGDCPGEWPMDFENGSTHDCSFDTRITKCSCQCHKEPENSTRQKRQYTANVSVNKLDLNPIE